MATYKAYIAANDHTPAFDVEIQKTKTAAIRVLKSRNSPDWRNCIVWVVAILNDGQEFRL